MRRLLDVLTSRRTSLALMAFAAASGALGAWIPQASSSSAEAIAAWETRNPSLAGLTNALGLHAIFSSWWFLALLVVFGAALAVATFRMVRTAVRWQLGATRAPVILVPGADIGLIGARARAAGYRERRSSGENRLFARHGAGMWASAVLHVGLLLSLTAGGLSLGLTTGAVADLSQGEVRHPGEAYYAVTGSRVAPEIGLPMRLDGIEYGMWESGGLKDVAATVSFLEDDTWIQRVVGVNHPLRVRGHTVYAQPGESGDAVFLILTGDDGAEERIRLEFEFAGEGQVVYAEDVVRFGDVELEGRWDPDGVRDSKPLALRPAGDSSAEPVTLAEGESAVVAGVRVEYVTTAQWARFIIQREPGIGILLLGFAVIAAGSLMLYAWIPRELVLQPFDGGVRYSWHAARMSRAYMHELDEILGRTTEAGEAS